jgi:multiple sugar transport system permease protein
MSVLTRPFSNISPRARREAIVFYLCVLPWFLGFIIFIAYPTARSIYLSFTNYQIGREPVLTGTTNFVRLYNDGDFWQSLRVTSLYVLGAVPGQSLIALGIAMLLAQKIRGISIWRTIYFLPSVISAVAIAVLWFYVFNPEFGLVNTLLASIGIRGPGWVFSEDWALITLVFMNWWTIGGQMVIYLAGLKGIPDVLYEAVEIDGGGSWAKFRHVTIPMLSPVILFNLVLGFIAAFQVFEGPLVLTNGGPNKATLTYMLNLYNQAFQFGNLGYASALALVLFAIILVLTLLIIRSSALWVYYEAEGK